MKLLVETTGSFSLNDSFAGQYITKNRPNVVTHSNFVEKQLKRKALKLITKVANEATDDAFAATWAECKGDKDLAIAAFESEFPLTASAPKTKQEIEEEKAAAKAEAKAKAKAEADAKKATDKAAAEAKKLADEAGKSST